MSTRVVGLPLLTGTPAVKLLIEYDQPWQGGTVGLAAKAYRATWDYTSLKWLDASGVELTIPLPRAGSGDPGLKGALRASITVTYAGLPPKTGQLSLAGYETSAGVYDLTIDPAPIQFTTSATLATLTTNAQNATASANAAAGSANSATTSANSAAVDTRDAATQALIAAGLNPQYVSFTTVMRPVGPEGTYGASRDVLGGVIISKVVGGVWVKQYDPTLTEAAIVTRVQTAWIDPTGSDVRGYVGRDYRPFRTFAAALAALGSETGARLILGNGTHDAPLDSTVWRDRLAITGSGMGFYAADNMSIVGPGTIIRGGLSMYRHSYLALENFAVDAGSAARAAIGQPDGPNGPGVNALHIYNFDGTAAAQPQMISINLRRIRALGEDVNAPYHAILCEGVLTGTFENMHTMKNTHGFVLKGTECTVNGVYAIGHQTDAAIFRSSKPYGFLQRLQASRLFAKSLAAPNDTGGFTFVANVPGELLTNFTATNINTFQCRFGVSFDASNGGTISDGAVSNAQLDGALYVGVGTAGGVQRVQLNNMSVTASLGNGFDLGVGGSSISLTDCRSTGAAGHGLNNSATDTRVNSGEFTASTGNDVNNNPQASVLRLASSVRALKVAGPAISVDGHFSATLVALSNGWSNLGGAQLPAGYRKSIVGEVALQGHITGGTVGQIAFILPVGFRPTGLVRYACNSNANALAGVAITAAGEVYIEVAPGWLSLDVIRFFVD